MNNNLFISYDLNSPGQSYGAAIDVIKSLGSWAKVQKSFWYVKSNYSAAQAVEKIWTKLDKNDSLIVIDATNQVAAWNGLSDEVAQFIKGQWIK
jgi:hypothetical protein